MSWLGDGGSSFIHRRDLTSSISFTEHDSLDGWYLFWHATLLLDYRLINHSALPWEFPSHIPIEKVPFQRVVVNYNFE